jgi:SAM-dependent methyltransferase
MDLPTFRELLAPAGQTAAADAAALAPTEAGFLAAFEKLRKRHPPPLAKAALETVLLRGRARAKFSTAERMYFTRESLEQASGEVVSADRARRFAPYSTVLDLCCGIGADAIQLALAGCRVEAADSDPLRLAMADANAIACGVADRIRFHEADVLTAPLPAAGAAFADPSRREGERRFLDPDRYQPPLGALLARLPPGFPFAAKIAPGVAWFDLDRFDSEVEFVSVGGELKECVLWFGPLRTATRRATVLPGPHVLSANNPPEDPPASEPQEYAFDPDPAVIRAGFTGLLAERLGASAVDWGVAFLTGPAPVRTPFAACYRVEHAAPFHLARLRDYLRDRHVGRVTVMKRASELDADEVTRKLKLAGSEHRVVILTRSGGKPWAIVGELVKRIEEG